MRAVEILVVSSVEAMLAIGPLAASSPPGGLVAPSAPPTAPVIYVHYDYMVGSNHSDAPQEEAIDMVVQAFKRQGIVLHIDPQHTAIPETPPLVFDVGEPGLCAGLGDASFAALKQKYFQPTGNLPWHYAIFAHSVIALGFCTGTINGAAALPGYDFVLGLGYLQDYGWCSPPFISFCQFVEGGSFMHELGHNLELHHGGTDDVNFKPNYLSVMNYNYQYIGIPFAASPGSAVVIGNRLDYSRLALPTLDENDLDERVGIDGPADDTDVALYSCEIDACFDGAFVPTHGPIDWNLDGLIESDMRLDLNIDDEMFPNRPFFPSDARYDFLTGFDDWTHVHQFLGTRDYLGGSVRLKSVVP